MKIKDVILNLAVQGRLANKIGKVCHVRYGNNIYVLEVQINDPNANGVAYSLKMIPMMNSEAEGTIETDKWICVFAKGKLKKRTVSQCIKTLNKKYKN